MNKSNKRKYISVLLAVGVIVALTVAISGFGTLAQFTDTHNDNSDASYAGSVDLKLNGEDKDVKAFIRGENMKTGNTYNQGTVTVSNEGSVEANLLIKVINPVSLENGRTSAEKAAGDPAGQEYDPTSLDANGGDGELWDQIKLTYYIDENQNGEKDWGEPYYTSPIADLSDPGDHLPLNTNLIPLFKDLPGPDTSYEPTLGQNEELDVGLMITFVDDDEFWSAFGDLKNNHAMTDDVKFTTVFDLVQK